MSRLPDTPEPDGDAESDSDASRTDGASSPLTWQEAIALLDTIPGINRRSAERILAETGIDMNRFPTAKHLRAWVGVAPGNHESGGKQRSGRRHKGNQHLAAILVESAWPAVRNQGHLSQGTAPSISRSTG
jgi:transposase